MEDEDNEWILGSPMIISKMGSPSASIATNMDTWQKNAEQRRRNKRLGHASNVIRKDTLQKTAKESK